MTHFYTNPLAAAWMHTEFGIEFRGIHHIYANHFYPDDEISAQSLGDLIESYMLDTISDSKVYLHPDSLRLLDPILGDVIQCKRSGEVESVNNDYPGDTPVDVAREMVRNGYFRIIQREGKPFFWPETEDPSSKGSGEL